MSTVKNKFKTLARFASKDPTKPHLGFIVWSETLVDKNLLERYPNALRIIPDIETYPFDNCFEFTVPNWFGKLDSDQKDKPISFTLNGAAMVTIKDPCKIVPIAFTLNARLLAPLAGLTLFLRWKDSMGPVHFTLTDEPDIYGVLMPMRG